MPAKAYVLCTKGHNGFNSCSKCKIRGTSVRGEISTSGKRKKSCVYFPGKCSSRRTGEEFRNGHYLGEYQLGETILNEIADFGGMSKVPIDYMHLVCLGVTKKLLMTWLNGPKNIRLTKKQKEQFIKVLFRFHGHIPKDFSTRKPKKLKHILSTWKAHDYRTFLLYTGPVILQDILSDRLYNHFLLLHVAITIFINPLLCTKEEFQNHAKKLLEKFVSDAEKKQYYGVKFLTHNVHNLLHLVEDVKNYGAFDEFGAFKYENYIGKIKKFMRKSEKPLQQLDRRLAEQKNIQKSECRECESLFLSKTMGVFSYEGMIFSETAGILKTRKTEIICNDESNNNVILNDGTVLRCDKFLKSKNNQWFAFGKKFTKTGEIYENSSKLLMFLVDQNFCGEELLCPVKEISAKLFQLPVKKYEPEKTKYFAVIPIIHTFQSFS